MGKGFHSNDSRVVVAETDRQILPAAYGIDLGLNWKPLPNTFINIAYWYLFLEQEFVYVGDAGIVEPSGRTVRYGLDFSFRYQPLDWIYWNVDANFAHPRSLDEEEGNNFIPLAPDFTLISGLTVNHKSGLYSNLNVRYLDDRPATEDNSIIAEGYTIFDLNAGYEWNKVNFGIQIQNLFDVEWKETQFATLSRLQNEAAAVEEIHFIPGTPLSLKGVVTFKF
jgi:outer membrane receptor protein involved in Fe transport